MLYFVNDFGKTQIANVYVWVAVLSIIGVYLTFYLLRSFGIYALTKRAGIKNAWLSFVPFAWTWVAGKLTPNAKFFGMPIKNFHIWFFIVTTVCQAFMLFDAFLSYFPLVGYYLQGGEIYISEYSGVAGAVQYGFLPSVYTAHKINVSYLYNQGFVKALNLLISIFSILDLVELVLSVSFYIALFAKYFPQRYFLAAILSVFGLFAPFVFAIRNNTPFSYEEYIKKRYGVNYGENANPYGQPSQRKEEPFGEFNEKEKSPFEEFDNDDFKN